MKCAEQHEHSLYWEISVRKSLVAGNLQSLHAKTRLLRTFKFHQKLTGEKSLFLQYPKVRNDSKFWCFL